MGTMSRLRPPRRPVHAGLFRSRRALLKGGAAVATTIPWAGLFAPRAQARALGPLVPDPRGILDLPEGFSYQIVERAGAPMNDGYRVPGLPDGMACLVDDAGHYVLWRNHEVPTGAWGYGPYRPGQDPPAEAYRADGMGGVTRVVIDSDTLERVTSNLALVGTSRNCSGGPSPWGWLSCEETTEAEHGYVFLCPKEAEGLVPAKPIRGYGRFRHEAVAVDPRTHIAYLTEDRNDGALYRFVPHDRNEPFRGRLEALRVRGAPACLTTEAMSPGDRVKVDWVELDEPDPPRDTLREEAKAKGAALFRRGEGIWWSKEGAYICATTGGPAAAGQIFFLHAGDGDELELVAQSESRGDLEMPDNITVAPRSGEVYMAEDGLAGRNLIRVLRPDGSIGDFARNTLGQSEFAGVCFSPDGEVLFVNLQLDGLTLAIRGSFPGG